MKRTERINQVHITSKQNIALVVGEKNPSLFVAQPVKWMNFKDS